MSYCTQTKASGIGNVRQKWEAAVHSVRESAHRRLDCSWATLAIYEVVWQCHFLPQLLKNLILYYAHVTFYSVSVWSWYTSLVPSIRFLIWDNALWTFSFMCWFRHRWEHCNAKDKWPTMRFWKFSSFRWQNIQCWFQQQYGWPGLSVLLTTVLPLLSTKILHRFFSDTWNASYVSISSIPVDFICGQR